MMKQQSKVSYSSPSRTFRVRSYKPADHAAVMDIFVAAIRQYPENVDEIQPHWQQLIQEGTNGDLADIQGNYFATGGHFWVATCEQDAGEEVVGMVAIKKQGCSGDAELVRLSVHPSYHRCGIGRLLVTELEKWTAETGFKRVWLSTAHAQRFYESIGYTYFQTKMHSMGIDVGYFEKLLL